MVSDGTRVIAGLDDAGDEPLMLARALPGVPVLVGADRYLSGRLAERRLGATVHILDDGFQHLELARDVDLLLLAEDDLHDRPLPAGRLRERLDAATAADAALDRRPATTRQPSGSAARSASLAVFRVTRTHRRAAPCRRRRAIGGGAVELARVRRRRHRAARALLRRHPLGRLGHLPARSSFAITTASPRATCGASPPRRKAAGSMIVLTTEKDAVRLAACDLGELPIAAVPLVVGDRAGGRLSATGCSIGSRLRQQHAHRSHEAPARVPDRPRR